VHESCSSLADHRTARLNCFVAELQQVHPRGSCFTECAKRVRGLESCSSAPVQERACECTYDAAEHRFTVL
jgi:hypothetical protein